MPNHHIESDDVVTRMARVIRQISGEHGACTGDDLVANGFSRADITRHGPDAVELAARRLDP